MKVAVLKERRAHEPRVAVTPDSIKKLLGLGASITVEHGAGVGSGFLDSTYEAAGASLSNDPAEICRNAGMLLCVTPPSFNFLVHLPEGAAVIGMLAPYDNAAFIRAATEHRLSAFAMELMPRISRAQSMDVLSSQSNLAGYRAVIEAVAALPKAVPMMMTAAGTVAPARVLVLGAGVAGLQAIATAKRLGAVVSAFDVRLAAKEQVESLGGKFIAVPAEESAETAGGYAKETTEDYKKRQQALIHDALKSHDIAITTALIPGKPAPVLITEAMVKDMKPGSVILDMAISAGGNCPLSRENERIGAYGVTILAPGNLPGLVAADASALYARNLYQFVATLVGKDGQLAPDLDDELVKATLLTHRGEIQKTFEPH